MTFFPSLPEDAGLAELQAPYPDIWILWGKFSEALMRAPGPLPVAERELIAAYVSGLNGCKLCWADHTLAAKTFGIDPDVFTKLMEDIDTSTVDEKMKPVLKFVRKLTQTPSKLTQADADAIYAAGWKEAEFHYVIAVCARYNFINRIVDGHGVKYTEEHTRIWKEDQDMGFNILPQQEVG